MSQYGIYLSFNNQEEGFQLPVNPSNIEVSDGSKGKTYDISQLGEISVIQNAQLTTYSFEGLLPAQEYPFLVAPLMPPVTIDKIKHNYYVYHINKWMETRRPIRFNFTGRSFEINVPVSIESFKWGEVAGAVGDIAYQITLKKYIFYSARKVSVQPVAADGTVTIEQEQEQRPNERHAPRTYALAPNEGLWAVAQSQLGDSSRWREIQRLNNIPDAELRKLPIGMVLKLP